MELRDFYNIYMGEDALLRASLIHSRNFDTVDEFVDFKLDELEDEEKFNEVIDVLSMTEAKRIHELSTEEPEENVYHNQKGHFFSTLVDFQYLLEENTDSFVIHRDVVQAIDQALLSRGIISSYQMRVSDETLEPEEISKLSTMYNGPIYWLYDNLTTLQLKKIIRELGITHYGKYKDDYLKAVIAHLTSPGYLKQLLENLSYDELIQIEENVRDNYNVFERKPRWSVAEKIGLLVKVHTDYLVMHQEVLDTLKLVNFNKVNSRRKEPENYNAYHLHATIEDKREIKRDIIVPVRLNFYEMIYILKQSFLWTNDSNSKIQIGGYELFEKQGQLPSSIVQVDQLLGTNQTFKFYYDSVDHYIVNVSLISTKVVDREVPKIIDYKGPIPIENIGGLDKLNYMLEVLEDNTHVDYTSVYNQVRSKNYRSRFPISAINKHLSRTFNIRPPKMKN